MAQRSSPISTVKLATTMSIRSMRRFSTWRRHRPRHRRCRASPPEFRGRSRAGTGRWPWCGIRSTRRHRRQVVRRSGPDIRGSPRHQVAVLVAAIVGFAFDVEVDPAGGGIAVGGAEGLDSFARRPFAVATHFVEADTCEPRLAVEPAAVADGEQHLILRAAGHEAQAEARPARVPPTEAEWTSKGMEAMERAAPVAMGERSRSRTSRFSERTQPESS